MRKFQVEGTLRGPAGTAADGPLTADIQLSVKPQRLGGPSVRGMLVRFGLAWGLPLLAQRLLQRIPNDPPVYVRRIPITVQGPTVLRADDGGRAFTVRPDDLRQLAHRSGQGGLSAPHAAVEMRPKLGWTMLDDEGFVSVVDNSGRNTAANSSSDPRSHGKGHGARLPLVVRDTWVLIHDLDGPPDRAEVVVLIAASAGEADRDTVARSVIEKVPGHLVELRKLAGGPPGIGRSTPPSGGPYGPPGYPQPGYEPPVHAQPSYGPSSFGSPSNGGPIGHPWPEFGSPRSDGFGAPPATPYGPPPTAPGPA